MGHSLLFYKVQVFVITFWAYISYHCSRAVWSYVQEYMREQVPNYTKEMTGYANVCFLFNYGMAMKMYRNHRYQTETRLPRRVAIGTFCAGSSLMLIAVLGFTGKLNLYRTYILNTRYAIFILMAINGISQSTGWPSLVAIMGRWYKGKNIGLLMGFWSGNQNIGDVLGLIIGDIVIQRLDVSCYWAIMFGATTLWLTTATILFTPLSPEDVDITDQVRVFDEAGEQEPINGNTSGSSDALVMPRKQVNFWNAWLLPGVALYVLGFVCLKGTYLGLLYWLPTYCQQQKGSLESQSSYIAQMYDYGTFLGGIVIGQLGDKYGMRAMFMCPCLLIAAGLMLLVKYTLGSAVLGYYFVMFGIGVFQGGPYNMISGAIAIELSNTPALEGNKRAVSLLSSIIEGSGILVGAAFQVVIPYVGSDQLFMMFTIVTVLAALVSAFIMFREFKRKRE